MHTRKVLLALAAVAAISPAVCNASPESDGMKACASAFAASIAPAGTTGPAYKLTYRGTQSSSAYAEYYTRDYTFHLQAQNAKTGVLARATCSTDLRGNVVTLSALAPEAKGPTLAAQF
jgi:hypothetical protein